jgi:signal transduction histidine kinase
MNARTLIQSKAALRREKFARYLVVFAVLLTGGFDIAQMLFGDGSQNTSVVILESLIDTSFIIATYFSLRSVISSRSRYQKNLAATLEELEAANAELIAAGEFKTRLMNMAAHDLRNPIGVVRGFSEILDEEARLEPEHRRMLQSIHKKSDEMLVLINDLLDAAVADQKEISLKKQSFVLDDLIEETMTDLQAQTTRKNQPLFFDSSGPVELSADRVRIKQVLVNLLSNASKYSPVGSPIYLNLTKQEKHVVLSVSDCGPGLNKDELENIFKAFSPVKKQTTGGETSTGLGLSIAKSLVERHGGKIWAASEGSGRGARFTVDLPL